MIDTFQGKYEFLSNFYYCMIFFEDHWYPSTEHAFQAAKTQDPKLRVPFQAQCQLDAWNTRNPGTRLCEITPGKAKHLGRELALRPDWESIKVNMMLTLVSFKFKFHNNLRRMLISTDPEELVEGNTWNDTFWGVCNGKGRNELGKILMLVRSKYA